VEGGVAEAEGVRSVTDNPAIKNRPRPGREK